MLSVRLHELTTPSKLQICLCDLFDEARGSTSTALVAGKSTVIQITDNLWEITVRSLVRVAIKLMKGSYQSVASNAVTKQENET
jgi:hypothetical protein